MKTIRKIALISIAVLATGCSMLASPIPKSDVQITRYALDESGKLRPSDKIAIPNKWAAESIDVEIAEEFQPEGDGEVLVRRVITITRITDPIVAGEVAKIRAGETAEVSKTISDDVAAVATAGISEADDIIDALGGGEGDPGANGDE